MVGCLSENCSLIQSEFGIQRKTEFFFFIQNHYTTIYEQESPPAWTQEAYRPSCSKYSLCCSNWVPPPPSCPGWGAGGYPTRVPPQQGTPLPLGRVPPPPGWTWQGTPPQVSAPWHSGKCCKALWDTGTPPPPGVNKLTKWNYYLPVVLRTRAATSQIWIFFRRGVDASLTSERSYLRNVTFGHCGYSMWY